MSDSHHGQGKGSPPYPGARRTYRMLGMIHALLFGVGTMGAGLEDGNVYVGAAAGLIVGSLTMAFFWKLADKHYRGHVPGKPGALVYESDADE